MRKCNGLHWNCSENDLKKSAERGGTWRGSTAQYQQEIYGLKKKKKLQCNISMHQIKRRVIQLWPFWRALLSLNTPLLWHCYSLVAMANVCLACFFFQVFIIIVYSKSNQSIDRTETAPKLLWKKVRQEGVPEEAQQRRDTKKFADITNKLFLNITWIIR